MNRSIFVRVISAGLRVAGVAIVAGLGLLAGVQFSQRAAPPWDGKPIGATNSLLFFLLLLGTGFTVRAIRRWQKSELWSGALLGGGLLLLACWIVRLKAGGSFWLLLAHEGSLLAFPALAGFGLGWIFGGCWQHKIQAKLDTPIDGFSKSSSAPKIMLGLWSLLLFAALWPCWIYHKSSDAGWFACWAIFPALAAAGLRICRRWSPVEMSAGFGLAAAVFACWCWYLWWAAAGDLFYHTVRQGGLYLLPSSVGWGLGSITGGWWRAAWHRISGVAEVPNKLGWPWYMGVFLIWAGAGLAGIRSWQRFTPVNLPVIPAWHTQAKSTWLEIQGSLATPINLKLYRGLPRRDSSEGVWWPWEIPAHTRVAMAGRFETEPVTASAEEIESLLKIIGANGSFSQWFGPKLCGGFHADWAVQWRDPGVGSNAVYEAHFCFGCHEAKISTPDGILYVDIPDATFELLQNILQRYEEAK